MHFLKSSRRVSNVRNRHRHVYRLATNSDTPHALHHTIRGEKLVARTPDEEFTTELAQTSGVEIRGPRRPCTS
jgi:hypothetical protein